MTRKKQQVNTWQDKKSKFQKKEDSPGKTARRIVAGVTVLILAAAVLYAIFGGGTEGAGTTANVTVAPPPGKDVRIPISDVSDGQARFYNYDLSDNQKAKFFVIKSSDGVIRAALDACIVCFRSRRGYHQQGDDMVCNNCNRHFRSVDVNVITGGCNPIPLTRSVEGTDLIVKAGDLEQGTVYF